MNLWHAVLVCKGLATYVPGLYRPRHGPGSTASARYCYSVWLRHLVMAGKSGLPTRPLTVAELGPGGSLGTGLAALLSGAEKYIGLDAVEHALNQTNIRILSELLTLESTM